MSNLHTQNSTRLRVFSETRPVTPTFAHIFLRDVEGMTRMFWHAGGGLREEARANVFFAAYGTAASIQAGGERRFEQVRRASDLLFANAVLMGDAPAQASARLFGGFSFTDDHTPEGVWSSFPAALFILPLLQLALTPEGAYLTVNAVVRNNRAGEAAAYADLARRFDEYERWAFWSADQIDDDRPAPLPQRVESAISQQVWQTMIERATAQMRAGEYAKVVLARSEDVWLDHPVNPMVALDRLENRFPETYRFLFEPAPGHAFFGATPELLTRVQGETVRTAALAGSRPRGDTPIQDYQLAANLMSSDKDRTEHGIVVESLRERLAPISHHLTIPDRPRILKLKNIQHLYTPVEAQLNMPLHAVEAVQLLHPTPALGGQPRDVAMQALGQLESTPRGWYAAPVGWFAPDGSGEFAVAIRAAVAVGQQARLYAGAGIVEASDPDKEWEETGWKFAPLMNALGVTPDLIAEAEQSEQPEFIQHVRTKS